MAKKSPIGSVAAAEILGCTPRRVQQRAEELGGRQVGGTLVFDEDVVRAAAKKWKRWGWPKGKKRKPKVEESK